MTIKDDKEVSGAMKVNCYGVNIRKTYPCVNVSPYLVEKISKKSNLSPHEAIFGQVQLTAEDMHLKDQTPPSEPLQIDQFDHLDLGDADGISNPGGYNIVVDELNGEEEEEEPLLDDDLALDKHGEEDQEELLITESLSLNDSRTQQQGKGVVIESVVEEPLIKDTNKKIPSKNSFFSTGMQEKEKTVNYVIDVADEDLFPFRKQQKDLKTEVKPSDKDSNQKKEGVNLSPGKLSDSFLIYVFCIAKPELSQTKNQRKTMLHRIKKAMADLILN